MELKRSRKNQVLIYSMAINFDSMMALSLSSLSLKPATAYNGYQTLASVCQSGGACSDVFKVKTILVYRNHNKNNPVNRIAN